MTNQRKTTLSLSTLAFLGLTMNCTKCHDHDRSDAGPNPDRDDRDSEFVDKLVDVLQRRRIRCPKVAAARQVGDPGKRFLVEVGRGVHAAPPTDD